MYVFPIHHRQKLSDTSAATSYVTLKVLIGLFQFQKVDNVYYKSSADWIIANQNLNAQPFMHQQRQMKDINGMKIILHINQKRVFQYSTKNSSRFYSVIG
ncbi:hypothetical protein ACTA71_004715 [Dictyostelium dimigraforme]